MLSLLSTVFKWDLDGSIQLSSPPVSIAVLADGNIAVYSYSNYGCIDVYGNPKDVHNEPRTCLYTIQKVEGFVGITLGYKNNLFVHCWCDLIVIPPGETVGLRSEYPGAYIRSPSSLSFDEPKYMKTIKRKDREIHTYNVVASNPTSSKLYYLDRDNSRLSMVDLSVYDLSKCNNAYEPLFTLIHSEYNFIDCDKNGRLLMGYSRNIKIVDTNSEATDPEDPDGNLKESGSKDKELASFQPFLECTLEENVVTSFQPPPTWLFVKARFAQAPKDNPDIYVICRGEFAWYNYVIYKYIWMEKDEKDDKGYVASGCIITGLDEPTDMQITDEGDVVCAEGSKNRVVVYRLKSVPLERVQTREFQLSPSPQRSGSGSESGGMRSPRP